MRSTVRIDDDLLTEPKDQARRQNIFLTRMHWRRLTADELEDEESLRELALRK